MAQEPAELQSSELGTRMGSGGMRCAGRQRCCVQRKQHQKPRGSAQSAEGPSAFLQETKGSSCASPNPREPLQQHQAGELLLCQYCRAGRSRGKHKGVLSTLLKQASCRVLQPVSPSPWDTSTHTQTSHFLGRDTRHPCCRAVGNVTRQKQRSPCALLRNSVSVSAWCKVQAWLIPGGAREPPHATWSDPSLVLTAKAKSSGVSGEAEVHPWDVHSAQILPSPAPQSSAQALLPRRVGVPECP